MGEVITKKAARERIFEDMETTRTKAAAKVAAGEGDVWKAAAVRLEPTLALVALVKAKLKAASGELAPLLAAANVQNDSADDLLNGTADQVWNEIGRPQVDPIYEVFFPEGTRLYTDATLAEQPTMMLILAELLEANLHPKLSAASASEKAAKVRASSEALAAAVTATLGPSLRVTLYEKVLGALGTAGQVALSKLKKAWKAEGMSEADVHSVIPDRPRSYGVGEADKPTTSATTTTAAPAPSAPPA